MLFFLGTHKPHWLSRTDVPLFVSRRRLAEYRTPPRARGPWALDSGAFTEIRDYGRWTVTARQYAAEAARWRDVCGGLQWAAVQDWPCEPFVLRKSGLSLPEHQRRTTASYQILRSLEPSVPWVPVLQGWGPGDYFRHRELYAAEGIDLASLPLVGIGSVCRRQGTEEAEQVIRELHKEGVKLHGFGFKLLGLARVSRCLASADSMAWSREARWSKALPGCKHATCANCEKYALWWRSRVLNVIRTAESRAFQGLLV